MPPTRTSPRPRRAFQWDLARQLERLDSLLTLLPKYADWGYDELYLHLEDAVEYPSLPGVARPHAYRHRELGRLVRAAEKVGIGVVPIANLLGHTQYLIKNPGLRDLNELRSATGDPLTQGQICPLHPRTPEVAAKLIRDLAPFCTAGKLHAGLDESFHLGKCPRCAAEVRRRGLGYHFSEHVRRMHGLVSGEGLRLGMWADMLAFVPEAIERLPAGIIAYDWYYYPFRRLPRVELFNFAEVDLATPLKNQGIEYWGCPMNGAFRWEPLPVFSDRLANIRSWWRHCAQTRAAGMLISSWEPYRLALEMTTVVDAAAASLWLDGNGDRLSDEQMLRRGFARVFGRGSAPRAARSALAADAYPFSGYARWEINDRWDLRAGADRAAAARERAHFRRAGRVGGGQPVPLEASLRFRSYLAEREHFVTEAASTVWAARAALASGKAGRVQPLLSRAARDAAAFGEALHEGRVAARVMWRRTRKAAWPSQNEALLTADGQRLRAWQGWIAAAQERPAQVWSASPVCGAWQLVFTVHNFAPALQRVSVEQQQPDGSWKELHGRHTIEFQAAAARPRSGVRRCFSVPVEGPRAGSDMPGTLPALRICLQGLGEVRLAGAAVTDGVFCVPIPGSRCLGRPAPSQGLPRLGLRTGFWALTRIRVPVRPPC